MRLFEAILESSQRSLGGDIRETLHPEQYADALPIVALTCIDPRLNTLIPACMGVPEDKFIWMRNAGNIITGPFSSTMRSLALACIVKGGKEIAIIGHTDCQIGKASMLRLTDAFRALGVDRAKLPENLVEYFGMFASERQNVIKAVDYVRQSPLIGPKIPVHGLLLDVNSKRLEWIVNGYQTLSTAISENTVSLQTMLPKPETTIGKLEDFKMGDMTFSDTQIGKVVAQAETIKEEIGTAAAMVRDMAQHPMESLKHAAGDIARHVIKSQFYKVIGSDQKVYGPITGSKLLQWLSDERIDHNTPVQIAGTSEWRPLARISEIAKKGNPPVPPPIPGLDDNHGRRR